MTCLAMICGSEGTSLSPREIAFFRETRPAGFILFARNCETPDQVQALTSEFLACVQHEALVLIDQEGGRVQRLTPPVWPAYPAGEMFGALYNKNSDKGMEAARLSARLIGNDLHALGINMDCLPVLDLAFPGRHKVIGDRAYHRDPDVVAQIGRAASEGLMSSGVLPVIKHIPGHGRADADSHETLPEVGAALEELNSSDFVPFRTLSDMPAAMTAHILYTGLDAVRPATTSPRIIREVIRESIGFQGLLMSDDVSMGALKGTVGARAQALFSAGCDLALHCNGDMKEMEDLAENTPALSGISKRRYEAALAMIHPPDDLNRKHAWDRLQTLLAEAVS